MWEVLLKTYSIISHMDWRRRTSYLWHGVRALDLTGIFVTSELRENFREEKDRSCRSCAETRSRLWRCHGDLKRKLRVVRPPCKPARKLRRRYRRIILAEEIRRFEIGSRETTQGAKEGGREPHAIGGGVVAGEVDSWECMGRKLLRPSSKVTCKLPHCP